MNSDFRFKSIIPLLFCSYFYWDFIYIEITIRYGASALNAMTFNHYFLRLPNT